MLCHWAAEVLFTISYWGNQCHLQTSDFHSCIRSPARDCQENLLFFNGKQAQTFSETNERSNGRFASSKLAAVCSFCVWPARTWGTHITDIFLPVFCFCSFLRFLTFCDVTSELQCLGVRLWGDNPMKRRSLCEGVTHLVAVLAIYCCHQTPGEYIPTTRKLSALLLLKFFFLKNTPPPIPLINVRHMSDQRETNQSIVFLFGEWRAEVIIVSGAS